MSVASTVSRLQFTITGLPQTLAVTFPFNVAADLLVTDGATVLVLNSDYTVTGGGYNALNQLQGGSVTVVGTGSSAVQVSDVITISRGISPVQTTTFASTGILTPLMIEQDDDKLTLLVQELLGQQYNPFPPVGGAPQLLTLGWITAETGGIRTSLDSLNVTAIPTAQLPLFVALSLVDDFEIWKLRAMQVGDPSASLGGVFTVPVTNPLSLIWVRVS
jgi:hypothetical protein